MSELTDQNGTDSEPDRRDVLTDVAAVAAAHILTVTKEGLPNDGEFAYPPFVQNLVEQWGKPKHEFPTLAHACLGLSALLGRPLLTDKKDSIATLSAKPSVFTDLSVSQTSRIEGFTFYDDIEQIVYDGTEAQASITATIALPGYISAKFGTKKPDEVLRIINAMSLSDVSDILSEDAFEKCLVNMAVARNGTYAGLMNLHDTGNYDAAAMEHYQEKIYSKGEKPIEPIDERMQRLYETSVGLDRQVSSAFSVYDLFELKDGVVKLGEDFVAAKRLGIELTNKYGGSEGFTNDFDTMYPTKGCPVVPRRLKLQEGFFGDDQIRALEDLAESGLAHFQNNTLDLKESVIVTLHKKLLEELRKNIKG